MKYLNFKKNIKTKATVIFTIIILSTAGMACAQTTNFSGTWKRSEKSTGGKLSINSIPILLSVSQDDNSVTIKKTTRNQQGDTSVFEETLKFDGSPSETVSAFKSKRISTVGWNIDHTSLNQTVTAKDAQGNVKQISKYIWTLEEKGKALKIIADLEIKDNNQESSYKMQEIFEK